MTTPASDNQADTTRDLWAEQQYPLCTKIGLRITPGNGKAPPGIPFEALRDRLQATGQWARWCACAMGGLTAGVHGFFPWDVENFLAGNPNYD